MLTACVQADSYFQVWALLDPWTVREIVLGHFPPLPGADEARGYLETLKQNGPAGEDVRETGRFLNGTFYSMANAAQFAPAQGHDLGARHESGEQLAERSEPAHRGVRDV